MGDEEGGVPYSWVSTEPLLEGVEEAPAGPYVKAPGKCVLVQVHAAPPHLLHPHSARMPAAPLSAIFSPLPPPVHAPRTHAGPR